MTLNAGSVEFIIKADTEALLVANKQVGRSLSDLDSGFNKTSKSVEKTEKSMLSLSKAAAAVASVLSIGVVVSAVDEWGQVAARIKMALKSVEGDVEKYAAIQERFLEISNRNGKAVEITQLLYVEAATSMQELGYNTEQTVDYTTQKFKAEPRQDTEFGFIASVPEDIELNFYDGYRVQSPSRYVIATSIETDNIKWVITDKRPLGGERYTITATEYFDAKADYNA